MVYLRGRFKNAKNGIQEKQAFQFGKEWHAGAKTLVELGQYMGANGTKLASTPMDETTAIKDFTMSPQP